MPQAPFRGNRVFYKMLCYTVADSRAKLIKINFRQKNFIKKDLQCGHIYPYTAHGVVYASGEFVLSCFADIYTLFNTCVFTVALN